MPVGMGPTGILLGGDGGNRTRVQRVRPRICYKLSRSLAFARVSPNRPGLARASQSKSVDLALMPSIGVEATAPQFLWHLIQVYWGTIWSDVAAVRQPWRVQVRRLSLVALVSRGKGTSACNPRSAVSVETFHPQAWLDYNTSLSFLQVTLLS